MTTSEGTRMTGAAVPPRTGSDGRLHGVRRRAAARGPRCTPDLFDEAVPSGASTKAWRTSDSSASARSSTAASGPRRSGRRARLRRLLVVVALTEARADARSARGSAALLLLRADVRVPGRPGRPTCRCHLDGRADPFFVDEGDIDAARIVESTENAELYLYPGDQHYFADSSCRPTTRAQRRC